MTRIEAFVPTPLLFALVREVAQGADTRLVFQRFESRHHRPGLFVVEPDADPASQYLAGGYQLAYVSVGDVPRDDQDWEFLERASAKLVELAGARQLGRDLEQVVIRPLAKQSQAAKLFKELQRRIASVCERGVRLNGVLYPRILYAKELVGGEMRLWVDIEAKSISAEILS